MAIMTKNRSDAARRPQAVENAPAHAFANFFTALHDAPVAAFVVQTATGLVLEHNLAARNLFCLGPGQAWNEIFLDPAAAPRFEEILQSQGKVEDYPALLRGMQGQVHQGRLHVRPYCLDGQEIRVIWCRDVSRQTSTEQALEAARLRADDAARARSDFLAHMSHELRTPMNGILGMSYLCLQTGLSPHQRNYVQKIQSSAYALLSDINDILDFSQIERGQLLLLHEPFTLQDVVGNLYARFEPQAREKGVELHLDTAPDLTMPLMGDSTRIIQMLGHLLGNALKFTEQGKIGFRICLEDENETWSRWGFCVTDTGMGMEPDLVANVLQPFTQADASMTRRFGGIGLGLTLTHRVLELMGGKLTVESSPGSGSSFQLSLPLEKASCANSPALCPLPKSAPLPEARPLPRVLLVEDSEINQEIALELLRGSGVDVDVAANGREALEQFERNNYQLVFMDIQMPEMDGLEAARRIRAMGNTVPIVAMTAHAQPEDREKSLAAGMNDHLTKPLKPEHLLRVLRTLVPVDHAEPLLLPAQTEETLGVTPDAACLNTGQGLDTVGGNLDLYRKLLRKFLDTYAAVDLEVARARELGDDALARRLAHTVKNVAASLGMQPLSLAMIEVENHLCADAADGLEAALADLHQQLAQARQAAREYLAGSSENQVCQRTPLGSEDAGRALELLDGLPDLLEQDAGLAIDRMTSLASLLDCTPLSPLLDALAREVENFDANCARLAVMPLAKELKALLLEKI